MIQSDHAELIAVGNGTAGRETENFVREALAELPAGRPAAPASMVSEAGASVYSASRPRPSANSPKLDVTVRGAVSIARRLQDPLAELVKIEPRSIGVGQYQHDVDQARPQGRRSRKSWKAASTGSASTPTWPRRNSCSTSPA